MRPVCHPEQREGFCGKVCFLARAVARFFTFVQNDIVGQKDDKEWSISLVHETAEWDCHSEAADRKKGEDCEAVSLV